ncbi:MAG: hypothetical protein O7B35_02695, partial [Deltaproteobacteria bacterium]|nr:hypothetical protein [Deltaproteobacteria bacterium]
SQQIRSILLSVTPAIEPVSLDEAYLDFSEDIRLDMRSAACSLADVARHDRVSRHAPPIHAEGRSGQVFQETLVAGAVVGICGSAFVAAFDPFHPSAET